MSHLIVAAIDFGTTFSGWAYITKTDFEADPTKIITQKWEGGQQISSKAPTTVLVQPDGHTLEAFGYKAESTYAELASKDQHENYYYFKQFKMTLHRTKELSRDQELREYKGKKLPAMRVFTLAIEYLKNDLLQEADKTIIDGHLQISDVFWVITVPAIWTDSAKQFMREAAEGAGITRENLCFALEPEAASLYCRLLPLKRIDKDGSELGKMEAGTKYMVLDAGGGTVDITVHEVQEDDYLREIYRATGGAWGGSKVDEAFDHLLRRLFQDDVMDTLYEKETENMLDLSRDFEVKKRDVDPDRDEKLSLRLPITLYFAAETCNKDVIPKTSLYGKVDIDKKSGRLKANFDVLVEKVFGDPVGSLISHLEKLFENPAVKDVSVVLMVGGFSASKVLQSAVGKAFPTLKIAIPKEPDLVVLKGAVVFGFQPHIITSRISKYTYGVQVAVPFMTNKHPPEYKFIGEDGEELCNFVFDKCITVGDEVVSHTNIGRQKRQIPVYKDQNKVKLQLFTSEQEYPEYTTDEGCSKLGELTVLLPESKTKSEKAVLVELKFNGTELGLAAEVEKTSATTTAWFDFLARDTNPES